MQNQINVDDKKQRKPLMEKKRRARINDSLENLKQILLECDPQSVGKKSAKLEKADILEMTVSYLQTMRKSPASNSYHQSTNYGSYSTNKYSSSSSSYVTVSSKSGNIGQYCYGGSSNSSCYGKNQSTQKADKNGLWRPW